jgi:Phosphoribosylglycinamide synthetase, ATP-grasp (A) domain
LLDARLERRIVSEVVEPTLEAARAEGFPFRGMLYCGLMITADGPKALEYNAPRRSKKRRHGPMRQSAKSGSKECNSDRTSAPPVNKLRNS